MTEDKARQNNEAFDAYRILTSNEIEKSELIEPLNLFLKYLENLCSNISQKNPKIGFIYQWIFCTYFNNTNTGNFCKANIFAARKSLKRIIQIIPKQELSPVFKRMLIDFICDLKIFINYFDKSQNYDWLAGNSNTHISNFYHDLSNNLFYNGKPGKHEEQNITLSSSTPFIIRQSIEYKIKRILGIDYIELLGKPHKTLANVYFKALKNNETFYKKRKFNFETVELIHSWTHLYIHGGYRAKPWVIETALDYLNELFYSGKTSRNMSFSLYAGIEILESDLPELTKRTKEFIKNEINNEAEIIWLAKPELAFLK